ncbi:helix-turn-helix transcriptional regulator [Malonomonas rubra]|uniref:helix-turn-helix transcriptional regulator n=1 Tax=Malonomonas rubra TaxID=57040 RepID=UPI0026EC8B9F|nr:helix-turn-helix transcriptional regulator [Malonomonas rubra]
MDFESRHNSSVSIDGEAIRNIREEKRLTQLYVAKVVGVTTDTVSRWENNRYPTIRRDNALKLAEALEVDFEEILKQEEPIVEDIAEEEVRPGKKNWLLLAVLTCLFGVVVAILLSQTSPKPVNLTAIRYLPPYAAPGSRVPIRVRLSSEMSLKGMILTEEFPAGWQLVASEPLASSLDNELGKARWIFRKPQVKTSVAYLLEVPKDAAIADTIKIKGELIANPEGQRTAIVPQSVGQMEIQPLHWADTNGNHVIEDLEILEVSNQIDETGQLPLDWDLIEKLWDAGGYRWDAVKDVFVPVYQSKTQVNNQPVN